jgi:hypothetical protein
MLSAAAVCPVQETDTVSGPLAAVSVAAYIEHWAVFAAVASFVHVFFSVSDIVYVGAFWVDMAAMSKSPVAGFEAYAAPTEVQPVHACPVF